MVSSSSNNSSSSRPVHVCIVRHSYVRRLQEFMCCYHPQQYDNLGFNRNWVVVHCLSVGGATVLPGDKCMLHQLSDIIHIHSDIVYVHVGENALRSLHGSNVSPITSHLCHIIDKLTPRTCIIFLSQLLLFPVYTHARESVLSVNNNTKCHCAQLESVNFWRHRGFCRQPVDILGQGPRRQT